MSSPLEAWASTCFWGILLLDLLRVVVLSREAKRRPVRSLAQPANRTAHVALPDEADSIPQGSPAELTETMMMLRTTSNP
jgi:hypothetical protein